MMMLSEVAKAVSGQLIGADVLVQGVDTDSRRIQKNQLFVAINGERFDGNQYAAEAIAKGAAAALISEVNCQATPAVLVKDSRIALGQLAAYWRKKMDAKVVAITGSNGKTTTKEMLAAILATATGDATKVHATQGNLNNDIGMPLTLLAMQKQHQYAVIEMGMNHLGEIAYLTHIAKPNVALINNAGTAHIGELGSRENIAKAKGEIYAGLEKEGIAVINADDAFALYWKSLNLNTPIITFGLNNAADVRASYKAHASYTQLLLKTAAGEADVRLPLLGAHNVNNALAATAAAVALGIDNQAIAQGLAGFGGVYGRLQNKQGLNHAVLIDDTYNANPDSMKAAIQVLASLKGVRLFVMGDMGELGEDAAVMHQEVGAYAKKHGIECLFSLGEFSKLASDAFGATAHHFQTIEALAEHVKPLMKSNVTVLVKGSRFMRMERVVVLLEVPSTIKKQNLEKTPCC